jgi:hypothetical protein
MKTHQQHWRPMKRVSYTNWGTPCMRGVRFAARVLLHARGKKSSGGRWAKTGVLTGDELTPPQQKAAGATKNLRGPRMQCRDPARSTDSSVCGSGRFQSYPCSPSSVLTILRIPSSRVHGKHIMARVRNPFLKPDDAPTDPRACSFG